MRPSWDEYFMSVARLATTRSTCNKLAVGAVVVKDKAIIATGYNGSIAGDVHCKDVGCYEVNNSCIRTVHAERNALAQCARLGASSEGATMYVTHFPCLDCMKQIIQSGISTVKYLVDYKNSLQAIGLCEKAGVKLEKLEYDMILDFHYGPLES